jgi:hypothetical protein
MTQRHRHNPDPKATRRRGSIYAVVLAMAILVSLIGLSAVAVGRINLRTASAGGDAAAAELLALSGIEHAIAVVNADSAWRSNYVHDQPIAAVPLGSGEFTWKLQDGTLDLNHDGLPDDTDGNLAGGLAPVRVVSTGHVGDARRSYSVVLVPAGANQLTNPGMESGVSPYSPDAANCVLEVNSVTVRNGLRSLLVKSRVNAAAGPRQDVTAKVSRNKWYYVEAWVRMSTSEDEPVICLVATGGGSDQVARPTRSAAAPAQKVGTDWKKVTYSINTNWVSGGYSNVYWRVETTGTNQDFYLDDVKMIEAATPMPMAPAADTWRQEQLN